MNFIACHDAHDLVNVDEHVLFIDVRTELEHHMVGHPVGCELIPWRVEPDWEENRMFVPMIEALATSTGQPIVLICRTGQRAMQAAERLEQLGYTNVYVVSDGFEGDLDENSRRSTRNGWRFAGLPWEQM
jgi:rhodanese-related sulfurtransferase